MPYRRRKKLFNEVNVIPYIDVSLVLLLVFMISVPLIQQGVDVELPKANAKIIAAIEEVPIVVTIDADAKIFLNLSDQPKQAMQPADLVAQVVALKRLNPNLSVFVRGDRKTYYANILRIMAMLQTQGIDKVGLMTDPTSTN